MRKEQSRIAACMTFEIIDELSKKIYQEVERYDLIAKWSSQFYSKYKNVDWTSIVEDGPVPEGLPDDLMYWDEFVRWYGLEMIKNITNPTADGEPQVRRRFTNGFRSWMETHHEIVAHIHQELSKPEEEWSPQFSLIGAMEGRAGFYDISEMWANEFELKNYGREWDGEFFDEIDEFVKKKIEE